MAARHGDAEGFPNRSRRHGEAPVGSLQSAVERVHARQEVVNRCCAAPTCCRSFCGSGTHSARRGR